MIVLTDKALRGSHTTFTLLYRRWNEAGESAQCDLLHIIAQCWSKIANNTATRQQIKYNNVKKDFDKLMNIAPTVKRSRTWRAAPRFG